MSMYHLVDDTNGAVEDIPFRLLIMVLLLAGTVSIATSGITKISELNMQKQLTEEMDSLGEVALATSSSGSGTIIHYVLELPYTETVSVSELKIGGDFSNDDDPFSSTFRIELTNGRSIFGTLTPGHHELNITNAQADGPYIPPINNGKIAITLVAIDCQNQNLIVMMDRNMAQSFDKNTILDNNEC
jgi:hypothetical protein